MMEKKKKDPDKYILGVRMPSQAAYMKLETGECGECLGGAAAAAAGH